MKFLAKVMGVNTKRDSGNDVYTEIKLRLYQFPIQGQKDPDAMKKAMWLTGLPYEMEQNDVIEVDIADSISQKK